MLNDIYRICVQTQQVCSLDAYVDTSWREQAQWWGDARVQAQNTFHISGDTRLLKRGIRSIARQEVPNDLTFGHAPTMAYSCILPDFSIIWVLTIWDYYFQTGDISLFIEQLPRIQRLLSYFTDEGSGNTGLLKIDPRYWLFLDWANIFKDGYHYERGMCLSLRYDDTKAVKKYCGNPEELFEELIAVYPELEGQFPQDFEQNYCTGIYISAINVPKVLKQLNTEYEFFRGLWLILKYAEQHNLAYWEGTDLPLDWICPVLPYRLEEKSQKV